jgi:hypothetical protein
LAIVDNAETSVTETTSVKEALVAELTWSKLYTKAMYKVLSTISTSIRKSKPAVARPEVKRSADKLHDQLHNANQTVGELSDLLALSPGQAKDDEARKIVSVRERL